MSETKAFTFANGRTVDIRQVSTHTLRLADRNYPPKPQPPTQVIDGTEETNYSDPDWLRAVKAWDDGLNQRRLEILIAFGVKADIDQEALTEFRATAERIKLAVPADDLMCYIQHLCIGTSAEDIAFQNALVDASIPTESKISEAADGFKSEVQEPGHPEGEVTDVGGDGRKPGV